MKIEKKQTVQLAVLGILAVGCVGYLSFSLMAPKPPSKATANKAHVKDEANSASEKGASGIDIDVAADSQGSDVDEGPGSLPARRDPFVPQKLPTAETQVPQPTTTPARHVPGLLRNVMNSTVRVPPINIKPLNPFRAQTAPEVSAQPAAQDSAQVQDKPEPEDEIVVTGVVRGENNVAIVRIGGTGRHVVTEGQTIDGRYQVASVTGDGAVLVYKNRHIPVKLGGVKNAK
jgi:hypothetical protein